MAGSRRTELTLFDCVKRTQEQEEESDGSEQEQVHSKRRRFEADLDSLTPERQAPSINDHQLNYITVENPSGPTTIVLNMSGALSNKTHVSAIHAVCLVLKIVFPVADQSKHLLAMDLRIGSMQLGRVAFFQATMTVVHTNKLL